MKTPIVTLLVTATMLTFAQGAYAMPAATSSKAVSTSSSVSPKITAKAKEWFHRFQVGKIDRSQLTPQVNSQLTDDLVNRASEAFNRLGQPTSYSFMRTYSIGGATGYDFLLTFPSKRIIEMIAFDSHGKLAGIDFKTFVPTKT